MRQRATAGVGREGAAGAAAGAAAAAAAAAAAGAAAAAIEAASSFVPDSIVRRMKSEFHDYLTQLLCFGH